jgi:hypothetical protein
MKRKKKNKTYFLKKGKTNKSENASQISKKNTCGTKDAPALSVTKTSGKEFGVANDDVIVTLSQFS